MTDQETAAAPQSAAPSTLPGPGVVPPSTEPPAAAAEIDDANKVAGLEMYDDPEWQASLKKGIKDQIVAWERDWNVRITALQEALGLERIEVMLYLLLSQNATIRGLAVGFQNLWNSEGMKMERKAKAALLDLELEYFANLMGLTEGKITAPPPGWKVPT